MNGLRLALAAGVMAGGLGLSGPVRADQDNYVDVARGRALSIAGDCVVCHTAPGGAPFAGGLSLATPFGAIQTANITPDDATGIGRWSSDDFARAMHEGLRPDGAHLYPAFPYTAYTKVSRSDTDAIFVYLRSLAPVAHAVDRSSLPFPFDIRASMIAWNTLFFTPGYFVPDPQRSPEFNRGAYLVEGLGHCGLCHTPMNALGASKADHKLQANQIDRWTAPNLTNDPRQGLGKWSADDIVQYLRTGQTRNTIASGPMAEVVAYSTSQMPDADLRAIATYLKEGQAAGTAAQTAVAAGDGRMKVGEAVFIDTCAACHNRSGAGVDHLFPRLAGNPTVLQDDPTSLIRVILTGVRGAVTTAEPTGPAMPSLGYRLTDDQVAAVVTYIRNSWGNAAPAVSAGDVAGLRRQVAPGAR